MYHGGYQPLAPALFANKQFVLFQRTLQLRRIWPRAILGLQYHQ
jgi:hypothetical protein